MMFCASCFPVPTLLINKADYFIKTTYLAVLIYLSQNATQQLKPQIKNHPIGVRGGGAGCPPWA